MNFTLIYFHRINFPSASGQTIQVIRDYYAMSESLIVHLLYRSPLPIKADQINDALVDYGAQLTPYFNLHCIVDGWFGKYRAEKKVVKLIKSLRDPVIIVTRVPDHTETAISIGDKFSFHSIKVIFELHETAIPHMVVTRQPTTSSLIEDGVHALMVKPDSPQDLARAVQYILDNYDVGQQLAYNAKKWVTQYSTDARAAKYKNFLYKLIDKI